MNTTETSLIVASRRDLPTFELNTTAIAAKEAALSQSALVGKVTDRDSKIMAVRAQQELKKVVNALEKERKFWKEPLLIAGRKLDTMIETEKLELEKELVRVTMAVSEFDDAERRRVAEEERLQREQIERIRREAEAEQKRIADELAAKERAAREDQEAAERKLLEAKWAADKLALEAKNNAQRQAAEKARAEAAVAQEQARQAREAQDAALSAERAKAQQQTAAIEEKAQDAVYVAAKPIEATHVAGQRKSTNWVITITDIYALARYCPDLVEFKPKLAEIRAALNEGRELRGVKAEREHVSGVRVPQSPKLAAIDV